MAPSSSCRICYATFSSTYLARLHVAIEHQPATRRDLLESVRTDDNIADPTRYRVYQLMVELIAKEAYRLHLRAVEGKLVTESYNLLLQFNKDTGSYDGMARLIAVSQQLRGQLIELPSKLGFDDVEKTRANLQHDEEYLVRMVRNLVVSESGREAIMNLSRDPSCSEHVLNLFEKMLHEADAFWPVMCGLSSNERPTPEEHARGKNFMRRLQRLNIRFSQASLNLTQAVHIHGVTILQRDAVASGGFAEVFLGEYRGNRVAVKRIRVASNRHADQLGALASRIYREVSMSKGQNHPNIIPFFGVDRGVFEGNPICIVTLWAEHQDVTKYVEAFQASSDEKCRLLYETSKGLSYLHRNNIVHGDLHCRNILVDHHFRVQLTDFGMANFADTNTASLSDSRPGLSRWPRPEYSQPEIFGLKEAKVTKETDVFDFSGVCWEIFDGRTAFHQCTFAQAVIHITRGHRPKRDQARCPIPTTLWEIMEQCWQAQPWSRPTSDWLKISLQPLVSKSYKTAKYKSSSLPVYTTKSPFHQKASEDIQLCASAESLPAPHRLLTRNSTFHVTRDTPQRAGQSFSFLINRFTKKHQRSASALTDPVLNERSKSLMTKRGPAA